MGFGCFWTNTAFEPFMYSHANVMIRLFRPWDDIDHVGYYTVNMNFTTKGVILVLVILGLTQLSRYALLIHA